MMVVVVVVVVIVIVIVVVVVVVVVVEEEEEVKACKDASPAVHARPPPMEAAKAVVSIYSWVEEGQASDLLIHPLMVPLHRCALLLLLLPLLLLLLLLLLSLGTLYSH